MCLGGQLFWSANFQLFFLYLFSFALVEHFKWLILEFRGIADIILSEWIDVATRNQDELNTIFFFSFCCCYFLVFLWLLFLLFFSFSLEKKNKICLFAPTEWRQRFFVFYNWVYDTAVFFFTCTFGHSLLIDTTSVSNKHTHTFFHDRNFSQHFCNAIIFSLVFHFNVHEKWQFDGWTRNRLKIGN